MGNRQLLNLGLKGAKPDRGGPGVTRVRRITGRHELEYSQPPGWQR